MAYEDGLIYVDTTTTPNKGVEIADLQRAVPVTLKRTVNGVTEAKSSSDLGVLAGTSVGDSVPDNAGGRAWTVSSRIEINPMAKYKPVRYNKLAPLTEAELKSTNYGLSIGSIFNASDTNPNNTWTYLKPRGKAPTPTTYDFPEDEPYRITDFKNYDRLACPPFAFSVSGELDNSIGLTFYIDTMSKEVYTGMRWSESTCIKLSELIALEGRYLCVAIHDMDEAGSCAVILNQEVSEIGQYGYTVKLYAETTTDHQGITYPGIDLLAGRDRNGHRFRFIVGMRNNNDGQSPSQPYKVLGTNQVSGLYSLALTAGVDRKDVVLTLLDTIGNLEFSLSSSTLAFTYVETVKRNGEQRWKKYLLTGRLYGTFVTPSGQWAVQSVSVDTYIRADAGYVNPIDNGTSLTGRDNVWSKGEIDVSLGSHTYSNSEVAYIYQVPVYIYIDAPASVQVSAKVRYVNEVKDADNTIIVSQ